MHKNLGNALRIRQLRFGAGRRCPDLKQIFLMSRKAQTKHFDQLEGNIQLLIENRGSLSDEDVKILEEAKVTLHDLRKKKGRTNDQILRVMVVVFELITRFLCS